MVIRSVAKSPFHPTPATVVGPFFNQNGEVIGILSSKAIKTEGAVFAVQSKYIFNAIDEIKRGNVEYKNVRISTKSSLGGLSRKQQAQKIENYVFMVKGSGKK